MSLLLLGLMLVGVDSREIVALFPAGYKWLGGEEIAAERWFVRNGTLERCLL